MPPETAQQGRRPARHLGIHGCCHRQSPPHGLIGSPTCIRRGSEAAGYNPAIPCRAMLLPPREYVEIGLRTRSPGVRTAKSIAIGLGEPTAQARKRSKVGLRHGGIEGPHGPMQCATWSWSPRNEGHSRASGINLNLPVDPASVAPGDGRARNSFWLTNAEGGWRCSKTKTPTMFRQ